MHESSSLPSGRPILSPSSTLVLSCRMQWIYTPNLLIHISIYLAANSCHPRHCKSSIPLSQALRIHRICSTEENFNKNVNKLEHHLLRRGHKKLLLCRQFNHVHDVSRESLLTHRPRTKQINRIPLITTFHPNLPNLQMITRSLLPVLHASAHHKKAVPEPPVIGLKRPKNLCDLLVCS
jgi:hypothetical protein